ncbi:hypothetical protein [Natronomonas sp. EA1]|uniref:hypothetical protein n=1 Tax=Natronomonas sp. EA1 TaxID=3421655 RepID=UPI003EC06E5C
MNGDTFVTLSLAAFGSILAGFATMGFSRIVLPYTTARLLATPFVLVGSVLVAVLFVRSVLAVTGIRPLE